MLIDRSAVKTPGRRTIFGNDFPICINRVQFRYELISVRPIMSCFPIGKVFTFVAALQQAVRFATRSISRIRFLFRNYRNLTRRFNDYQIFFVWF